MAAGAQPPGRGPTGRRPPAGRLRRSLRRWFRKGRDRGERAAGAADRANSYYETAGDASDHLESAQEAFADPSAFLGGLLPGSLGRLGQVLRSRWTFIGAAWAAFLAATPWLTSQVGPHAEAAKAAVSRPSGPTLELADGLDAVVRPVRESVEQLAGQIHQGELSRLELDDRLRDAGRSLEGLVDLTVAYEPYASPTGARLDAPAYLPADDRLIQREAEEGDYALRPSSAGTGLPWFDDPRSRQGPGWTLAGAAAGVAGLHFGTPFGGGAAGPGFDGVVSATLAVDPIAAQMDELAEAGEKDGVRRAYLLGPDGEVLHRADAGGGGLSDRLASLFDPAADAVDAEVRRFGSRLLSGTPGEFALKHAGSIVERGRQIAEPGWVEHVPLPETGWTLAVVYGGQKKDEEKERRDRLEKTGLGVFSFLIAATVLAGLAGASSTKGGKLPPSPGNFRPGALDYPDAPASPGSPSGPTAAAAPFDAFLRRVLNQVSRRQPETAGASSAVVTAAQGSTGNSAAEPAPIVPPPADLPPAAPAIAAQPPAVAPAAADFPVDIQVIADNPPIAANLIPTLFQPGAADQLGLPGGVTPDSALSGLNGLLDRFSLEQLNRDTYGGLGGLGGGGGGGSFAARGPFTFQPIGTGLVDRSLANIFDPHAKTTTTPPPPPGPTLIPEPGSFMLAAVGLILGLLLARRLALPTRRATN